MKKKPTRKQLVAAWRKVFELSDSELASWSNDDLINLAEVNGVTLPGSSDGKGAKGSVAKKQTATRKKKESILAFAKENGLKATLQKIAAGVQLSWKEIIGLMDLECDTHPVNGDFSLCWKGHDDGPDKLQVANSIAQQIAKDALSVTKLPGLKTADEVRVKNKIHKRITDTYASVKNGELLIRSHDAVGHKMVVASTDFVKKHFQATIG